MNCLNNDILAYARMCGCDTLILTLSAACSVTKKTRMLAKDDERRRKTTKDLFHPAKNARKQCWINANRGPWKLFARGPLLTRDKDLSKL